MIAREMGKRWQALSCFRAFGPFPATPERHCSVPTPLVGGHLTGRDVDANPPPAGCVCVAGQGWSQRRRRFWVAWGYGLLPLGCLLARQVVALNGEPSVPLGVWWLRPVPATLERGMVVHFPAPEASFPWHPWWVPFLKPVAAMAGDVVCVDTQGLWVRGQWYGPVVAAAAGRRLPHLEGCQTIRAGEVFVASREARSLDSRYYGPVQVAQVTHVATPAWTWR